MRSVFLPVPPQYLEEWYRTSRVSFGSSSRVKLVSTQRFNQWLEISQRLVDGWASSINQHSVRNWAKMSPTNGQWYRSCHFARYRSDMPSLWALHCSVYVTYILYEPVSDRFLIAVEQSGAPELGCGTPPRHTTQGRRKVGFLLKPVLRVTVSLAKWRCKLWRGWVARGEEKKKEIITET